MGYKKINRNLGFADVALANSLKHNRSLTLMDKLNRSLNWERIQSVLMSHYTVGTSAEGADAYPPLLLLKCLMLQKWFRINSDRELEDQINDRLFQSRKCSRSPSRSTVFSPNGTIRPQKREGISSKEPAEANERWVGALLSTAKVPIHGVPQENPSRARTTVEYQDISAVRSGGQRLAPFCRVLVCSCFSRGWT